MTEFSGKNFSISYPENWELDTMEMNNPQSIALVTLKKKINIKESVTFQLINLYDSADFESGVRNFLKKYSSESSELNLKKTEYNSLTFITTPFDFATDVSSENYFFKENENLFWLVFLGRRYHLNNSSDEMAAILETFRLKFSEPTER